MSAPNVHIVPDAWHADYRNVLALAAWLVGRRDLVTAKDTLAYFESPRRFDQEWEQYSAVQSGDAFVCRDCDECLPVEYEDQKLCEDCFDRRHHDAAMSKGADK